MITGRDFVLPGRVKVRKRNWRHWGSFLLSRVTFLKIQVKSAAKGRRINCVAFTGGRSCGDPP